MKRKVGLWINHQKAVIFSLADEGAGIKRISSELENDAQLSIDAQKESSENHGKKYAIDHLSHYYDEVFSYIRNAESILIFGPGGAKLELQRRLKNVELHGNIVAIETVDTMTDNQIVAKVRQHFLT
jgi:stalled ribosome rescue protein Dom34